MYVKLFVLVLCLVCVGSGSEFPEERQQFNAVRNLFRVWTRLKCILSEFFGFQPAEDPDATQDTFEGLIPRQKRIWEGSRGIPFGLLRHKLQSLYMSTLIDVVLVGFDGAG